MSKKKKNQQTGKKGKKKEPVDTVQQKGGKKGKRRDFQKPRGPELEDELYGIGLRVKYMMADGNCFFRSLGDQLYGHDRDHLQIRTEVMDYMQVNRSLFEAFLEPCLEDDEDYDSYVAQMREAGQWAGHFEVHAASLCFRMDICIYQIDNAVMQCLCNKNPMSRGTVHISYHGGEHYNSVRSCGDYDDAPPRPIKTVSVASGSEKENRQKWSWKDEKRIVEETGCHDDGRIHQCLEDCDGNVNEAIDRLIEWMRDNDCLSDQLACLQDENNPLMTGAISDEETDERMDPSSTENPDAMQDASVENEYEGGKRVLREDVAVTRRKPGRKQPCPCGSGRIYKDCCRIAESKRKREQQRQEHCDSSPTAVAKELSVLYI